MRLRLMATGDNSCSFSRQGACERPLGGQVELRCRIIYGFRRDLTEGRRCQRSPRSTGQTSTKVLGDDHRGSQVLRRNPAQRTKAADTDGRQPVYISFRPGAFGRPGAAVKPIPQAVQSTDAADMNERGTDATPATLYFATPAGPRGTTWTHASQTPTQLVRPLTPKGSSRP